MGQKRLAVYTGHYKKASKTVNQPASQSAEESQEARDKVVAGVVKVGNLH